jgi:hypothetical protein
MDITDTPSRERVMGYGMRFDVFKLLQKRERTADGVPFSSMDVISGKVREVRTVAPDGSTQSEYRQWKPTKRLRRIMAIDWKTCDAKTRTGKPCKRRPISGRRRCRNHGGLSTGPKTPEGRERIAQANRQRAATRAANRALRIERGEKFGNPMQSDFER